MKKIISIALTVVLSLTILAGCGGGASYKDGTYTGEGEGKETIKVSVEVASGKIAKVVIVEQNESKGFTDAALKNIPEAIVKKNSTKVDTVAGVSLTSRGIIEAVNNALEKAKK